MNWFKRNCDVYFSNPTALRDFRTSLRGNRAMWLWGMYLAFLTLIAVCVYASIAVRNITNIAEIQQNLGAFYAGMMGLLGGMITLITPTMTASSIAQERQRKSLDLVITAPIETKAYLVGKMLSTYRYTWLLLVLSLPVSATAVVLGGATWVDVLNAYILLSVLGIAFSSVGLLMSTIAPKPITAVVWTYLSLVLFSIISTSIGSIGLASSLFMRHGFSLVPREMPFFVALNPFTVGFTASSYMTIYGHNVPNWILVGIFSLLVSKIMLLGAASHLSSFGSKETRALRIHGLIYAALLTGLITCGLASVSGLSRPMTGSFMPSWLKSAGYTIAWTTVLLSFMYPLLVTFGWDSTRKFRPDGMFNLRNAFVGTPSGSLPYLTMLWASMVIGALIGGYWRTGNIDLSDTTFWSLIVYALGYTLLFWGLGRIMSAYTNGLRAARSMMFCAMLILLVIPWPILAMIDASMMWRSAGHTGLWYTFVLTPMTSIVPALTDSYRAVGGVGLILLGGLFGVVADARVARASKPLGATQ